MKKRDKYLMPGAEFKLRGVRVVIKRRANNPRNVNIIKYNNNPNPSRLGWVDLHGNVWYENEFQEFIKAEYPEKGLLTDYKPGIIKVYNRVKLKLGS